MKFTGPYLTLAGGLSVAAVLLALSMNADSTDEAIQPSSAAAATSAPVPSTTKPAPKPVIELVPAGTYAGRVQGGGASIAIAVKGSTAIAYVCDGKKVEAWLQGSTDDAPLALAGTGDAALTAKYSDGRLTGTVRSEGKKWNFRVKAVKPPSGLYRAAQTVREAEVVGGWIVADGEQVGVLDRNPGGPIPAPPIDLETGTVTVDGTELQTTPLDGSPVG